MSRETITAVILTKNVEGIIERCLKSILWMDEIIIVDGCSADKTIEIAGSYGAKVITHKFNGSFAEERNLGIAHSTKDWIIQMDADEVMTEGLRVAIENILALKSTEYAGYKFLRKNYFLGHPMIHGGWHSYMTMFFKRGCGSFKGLVHETLELNGKMGVIKEDMEHYPFQSIAQFIDRQNKYTTLEARQILEQKGVLPEKEIFYNIKWKPLKLFWKLYIKKKGLIEGRYGFIFSIFYAWVHFLKWAKYWELTKKTCLKY